MVEKYGFGDQSAFIIYLTVTFVAAGFQMHLVVLFTGPKDEQALFKYSFPQSLIGSVTSYRMVNEPWAEVEGVKATAEGWIAPLIF